MGNFPRQRTEKGRPRSRHDCLVSSLWGHSLPHALPLCPHRRWYGPRHVVAFADARLVSTLLGKSLRPAKDSFTLMPSTQGQRKASIIFGKRKDGGASSTSPSSNPDSNSHLARSPSSLSPSALVRIDPRWPCFACRASRAKCKCGLLPARTRTWGATGCVVCSPFAALLAVPLQESFSLTSLTTN